MKHMRVNVGSLFWLYRPLSTWMDFLLPPLRFNLSTALDAAGYGKRVPYKPAFQSAEKVRSSTGLPSGGDLTIRQSPFAFPGIFFISSCVSSALLAMVLGRHTTQSYLPVFGCVLATAAATSCRITGIDSVILAVRKYNGDIRYELEGETLLVCVILNPSQGKCTKSRPGSQVMLRPLA